MEQITEVEKQLLELLSSLSQSDDALKTQVNDTIQALKTKLSISSNSTKELSNSNNDTTEGDHQSNNGGVADDLEIERGGEIVARSRSDMVLLPPSQLPSNTLPVAGKNLNSNSDASSAVPGFHRAHSRPAGPSRQASGNSSAMLSLRRSASGNNSSGMSSRTGTQSQQHPQCYGSIFSTHHEVELTILKGVNKRYWPILEWILTSDGAELLAVVDKLPCNDDHARALLHLCELCDRTIDLFKALALSEIDRTTNAGNLFRDLNMAAKFMSCFCRWEESQTHYLEENLQPCINLVAEGLLDLCELEVDDQRILAEKQSKMNNKNNNNNNNTTTASSTNKSDKDKDKEDSTNQSPLFAAAIRQGWMVKMGALHKAKRRRYFRLLPPLSTLSSSTNNSNNNNNSVSSVSSLGNISLAAQLTTNNNLNQSMSAGSGGKTEGGGGGGGAGGGGEVDPVDLGYTLRYYKQKADDRPCGVIMLTFASVVKDEGLDQRSNFYQISVCEDPLKRVYELMVETESEQREWLHALHHAVLLSSKKPRPTPSVAPVLTRPKDQGFGALLHSPLPSVKEIAKTNNNNPSIASSIHPFLSDDEEDEEEDDDPSHHHHADELPTQLTVSSSFWKRNSVSNSVAAIIGSHSVRHISGSNSRSGSGSGGGSKSGDGSSGGGGGGSGSGSRGGTVVEGVVGEDKVRRRAESKKMSLKKSPKKAQPAGKVSLRMGASGAFAPRSHLRSHSPPPASTASSSSSSTLPRNFNLVALMDTNNTSSNSNNNNNNSNNNNNNNSKPSTIATSGTSAAASSAGKLSPTGSPTVSPTISPVISPRAAPLTLEDQCRLEAEKNAQNLMHVTTIFVDKIIASLDLAPPRLRQCAHYLVQNVIAKFPGAAHSAVGGFLFLRFICPAILSGGDWRGGGARSPSPKARRNFLLITKLLQNLANGVTFGGAKEPYMTCLNGFIDRNLPRIEVFFEKFADPPAYVLEPPPPNKQLRLEHVGALLRSVVKMSDLELLLVPLNANNPTTTTNSQVVGAAT